jgi:hypothetical protein
MKQTTIDHIIDEARQLRAQVEADWNDYEHFKRRIAEAVGYGDEYGQAIRRLTEALEL